MNASHWLKKRPVWAAILVVFAIGCWLQLGYRRSAASWFELYCRADRSRLREEAERELKTMGSKSVPFLVQEALSTKEDTQTRRDFYDLLSSTPRALRPRKYVSYEQRRANARDLLQQLNPPAPEIIAAMRNSLSMVGTTNRYRALSLLSYTTNRDEVAAPYFISALHDPLEATRKEGLHWLATKSDHEATRDTAEEVLNRLAKNLEPIDLQEEKRVQEAVGRFVRSVVDE